MRARRRTISSSSSVFKAFWGPHRGEPLSNGRAMTATSSLTALARSAYDSDCETFPNRLGKCIQISIASSLKITSAMSCLRIIRCPQGKLGAPTSRRKSGNGGSRNSASSFAHVADSTCGPLCWAELSTNGRLELTMGLCGYYTKKAFSINLLQPL